MASSADILSWIRGNEAPGEPRAAPSASRDAARPQRVVAALPFDNLSSDPELQYFSDGVSEEIIRRLSRGANITVIGRASSFQFRADRKGEAARSLECSHVLDGSVRRAAGRVRIIAHLVEAAGTTTVWSDRYDRDLADVCARLGLVEYWTTSGKWPDCADEVAYDFRAECARVRDVTVEPFGF